MTDEGNLHHNQRRLGYLSGAPRVSTRHEAGADGPRVHVLGVMSAFRALGWDVRPYIVGDRVPLAWVLGDGSDRALRENALKRLAADMVRLGMGIVHGLRATKQLRDVDGGYKRHGPSSLIIHVVTQMEAGGAQGAAIRMAEHLVERGFRSEVWFLYIKRPTYISHPIAK